MEYDYYIIGTLSRIGTINTIAEVLKRNGYKVKSVQRNTEKTLEDLIIDCYRNIQRADNIIAVPHEDGRFGMGTQYEIAYAKMLGKTVTKYPYLL